MAQTSGQEFLACLEQATAWQPGMKRKERPIHEALSLFHGEFEDNKDTIVVIDEIQESSKVYSMIRQFAREFECDFIVTGSYLGKTREKRLFPLCRRCGFSYYDPLLHLQNFWKQQESVNCMKRLTSMEHPIMRSIMN